MRGSVLQLLCGLCVRGRVFLSKEELQSLSLEFGHRDLRTIMCVLIFFSGLVATDLCGMLNSEVHCPSQVAFAVLQA